jgi:hypothetical protein
MKVLQFITICVLFCHCYFYSGAQEKIPINQPDYNKARLFDDIPKKIILKTADMESLFDFSVGSPVIAKFSKDFYLQGAVVSKSTDATVKAIVIKATNRQGAVFTFTKIAKSDGACIYKGRILSRNNSDAFEIVKENDQYVLQKKNYYEIVSE